MILYVCRKDGAWYAAAGLAEALASLRGQELILPCPQCALPMYRVQPGDLVRVQPAIGSIAESTEEAAMIEGGQPT